MITGQKPGKAVDPLQRSWVPTHPPHPQEKSHPQGWLLPGPGPTFLPASTEQDAAQGGWLGATQASILILVPPLTGPTAPNLNFFICVTRLGHEDKVKLCLQNASSGCGTDHVLGEHAPPPSLSAAPAPPDAQAPAALRLRGRLGPSSASSTKKGEAGAEKPGHLSGLWVLKATASSRTKTSPTFP